MMQRLAALLIGIMSIGVLVLSVSAQTETPAVAQYQLRELDANEFLTDLPPSWGFRGSTDLYENTQVLHAAEAEWLIRFGDSAEFYLLLSAFDRFRPAIEWVQGRSFPVIDMNAWVARLTERWLQETPTDLDTIQQLDLRYSELSATVEPYDLDADGQHEWLLNIQYREFDGGIPYRNYLVVKRDGDGYRVLAVPIPFMTDNEAWERNPSQGMYHDSRFRDVNDDGLPEWLFSINYWGSHSIYVIGLRNGEMKRLFAGDGELENVDNDAADEIVMSDAIWDNWGCRSTRSLIYEWDGEIYSYNRERIYTSPCTARNAEEAMWAGDFTQASILYDTLIEQGNFETYLENCTAVAGCDGEIVDYNLYIRARRVIAYALIGDIDRVRQLLEEAQTEAFDPRAPSPFMQALLATNSSDPETLCQAAYNYFVGQRAVIDFGAVFPNHFAPGFVLYEYALDYITGEFDQPIDPVRAGCDPRLFGTEATPIPTQYPTRYPTTSPPTPDTRSERERLINNLSPYELYMLGAYDSVLYVVEQTESPYYSSRAEWQYWQALAYAALNQPERALEIFTEVYQQNPGSWWGWMAGIHLELTG